MVRKVDAFVFDESLTQQQVVTDQTINGFYLCVSEEFEHLDWSARMRLIMGTAYCLQHMHELNPPISHPKLRSSSILISEDFAAKVTSVHILWYLLAFLSRDV